MNKSLDKLRKKYIITASAIVSVVVVLMVIILNLLMRISYRNDNSIIEDVIRQTAEAHLNQPVNEHFELSDAEQTNEGDYIIPRSIKDISRITVYGNIKYNGSAIWYSAGGGLLFEAQTPEGIKMFYKDYSFSRDAKSVSISFEDYDNVKSDLDNLSVEESQIIGDYFLVSVIWWKNSSNKGEMDDNVEISIDSIDISYKNNAVIQSTENSLVAHSNFSDIFPNYIPEVLNNTSAFYLVSDKNNQLVSVNDGSLMNPLENSEASEYLKIISESDKKNGKISKDNTSYRYSIFHKDNMNVIIFINDSFTHTANGNLLRISVIVGIIIIAVLIVIIFFVSGYVIKPVADSIERQNQFISDASHELKTPITVISATIDIISTRHGEDCWTECIKKQAEKMQKLVKELLTLSKLLEINTARSAFTKSNISDTVSESLLYFESLLFESSKTLEDDIQEDIYLNCDANKISQLVGILMDNALKYSDEKSTIKFSLKKINDNAVISCSNPCTEFSSADTSKLFERFFRSDNDHIHEQEGFGLGLSIAKAIAELHGGSISASYKNNIITFNIILKNSL